MRRLFVALCLLGSASQALAGDFDVLRGSSPFIPASPTYARWSGVYAGGWLAHSSTEMNFAGATESLIKYLLRTTALENEQHPSEWGVLGKARPTGQGYGAFVGYNTQWADAVVSLEMHYNRANIYGTAPVSPITRAVTAGGNSYVVNVSGDASMRINDYGSARVRAGWAAGNYMPYGTLGFAVGRVNVARSAQVTGAENPPTGYPTVPCDPLTGCVEFNYSASEAKNSAYVFGWSIGAGMDVLVMPNFFVRAEYEYTSFGKIQGIEASMNTLRVGAGIKF